MSFIEFIKGRTRYVLLVGKYAFKFPCLGNWRGFLKGLQGNMFEADNKNTDPDRLAPVLFSIPGGFLIVMPRCEIFLSDKAPELIQYFEDLIDSCPSDERPAWNVLNIIEVSECRNFGFYQGRVVAIDYGHGYEAGLNRYIIEEDRKKRRSVKHV